MTVIILLIELGTFGFRTYTYLFKDHPLLYDEDGPQEAYRHFNVFEIFLLFTGDIPWVPCQ